VQTQQGGLERREPTVEVFGPARPNAGLSRLVSSLTGHARVHRRRSRCGAGHVRCLALFRSVLGEAADKPADTKRNSEKNTKLETHLRRRSATIHCCQSAARHCPLTARHHSGRQ
jgi:hypothetical protein